MSVTTDSGARARWDRVCALFEATRALPRDDRMALLAACDDEGVRTEVEALLSGQDQIEAGAAGDFLDRLDPLRTAMLLARTEREPAPGDTIGRYHIVRRLGSGGMGVVYLAHDPRLDRSVALKLLPSHLSADGAARRRFEEEARAASALDHPNIVTVYEIGDAPDGSIFIAMALCEGITLRAELDAGVPSLERVLALGTQLADGLAAAHRCGVVHRDIKPGNIIVTPDGVARIVDFGVAKTRSSETDDIRYTPGTISYMSPEQTRGADVDARSDVWALGVLLYEMLTGRLPFEGTDRHALVAAIRNANPEPLARLRPDAPAALSRFVTRCLSQHPAQRPRDGAAAAAEMRALGVPGRRRRRLVAAVAVVLGLGGIAFGARVAAGVPQRLEPRRIAVAPVENRTGAPELAELASMAMEWVTHGLWQTGLIQVVPLAPYGVEADRSGTAARAVALETGARLLLATSVYRDGDVARLQARVLDVADGTVVASFDPIEAQLAAPLHAAEELRVRVQSALNARLDTRLTHVRALDRPPALDAYRAYLAGRDRHAARDLPGALIHFRNAEALDPTFALPRVTAAVVLNMMGNAVAADSISRTLAEDADGLDAMSRAHVTWLRAALAGDRQAAQAGMREAARLAPGSTIVNYQYAEETLRLGRPHEAARVLYSFTPERGELRGWFHYWQALGAALHLQGRHRRELSEARRARSLYPTDPRALLLELHALAALGRTTEIEQLLEQSSARLADGEPNRGALLLATALELRAHAPRWRRDRVDTAADRLLQRASAWLDSVPAEQRTIRARYEHTLALGLLGRRTEARRLLAALDSAPATRPGPSPFGARGSPHYPDAITFRGAAGVLAAQDGDTAFAYDAISWLESHGTSSNRSRASYWRAAITAALGDREQAVALLRAALSEGLSHTIGLHQAPELVPLRDSPAFRSLMTLRE
jgi:TolB-like protein